jgi:biopolymer transport protein ExbB
MKRTFIASTVVLGVGLSGLPAQTYEEARSEVRQDLREAKEELADLLAEISAERTPLATELEREQNEVQSLRAEASQASNLRDSRALALDSLESEIKVRQDEITYLNNLMSEYLRSFETRIDVSEIQYYDETLTEIRRALENPDTTTEEEFTALAKLVDTGLERTENLLGGKTFPGRAISPAGNEVPGKFGLFGPISWFAASSPEESGTIIATSSLDPKVVFVDPALSEAIMRVVNEGSGIVPLDPTLVNASAMAETETSLMERAAAGGIWIIPILFFAGLSILVAIFKALEIYSIKRPSADVVTQILNYLREGKEDEAMKYARTQPQPYGDMLVSVLENRNNDREMIDEAIYEQQIQVQPKLNRLLALIAVTAAVAPLLGLLGTVTGIIKTFNLITVFGTGDPRLLADGISEALITTEFGLLVAIPSLILHALLSRRAQSVLSNMERIGTSILNGLSRQTKTA